MGKQNLPIQIEWLLSLPLIIFKISLIFGTSLLLLFGIFRHIGIAYIGYYYLLLAVVINMLALALLVTFSFIEKRYQKQLLLKTSIMLLNIPIAALYYYIFLAMFFN